MLKTKCFYYFICKVNIRFYWSNVCFSVLFVNVIFIYIAPLKTTTVEQGAEHNIKTFNKNNDFMHNKQISKSWETVSRSA